MADAPFVQDLLANLTATRDLFESLQDLLLRERQELLHLNVEGILRETAEKEELALRHRLLETERQQLLELAGFGERSLEEIAFSQAEHGQLIRQRGAELRGLVDATTQMNQLNRRLVGASLASLARQVERLSRRTSLQTTYATRARGTSALPALQWESEA